MSVMISSYLHGVKRELLLLEWQITNDAVKKKEEELKSLQSKHPTYPFSFEPYHLELWTESFGNIMAVWKLF